MRIERREAESAEVVVVVVRKSWSEVVVVVRNWVRISVVGVGSWMIWCDFIKYVFLVGYFNLALIIILNIASTDVVKATSLQELIFGR